MGLKLPIPPPGTRELLEDVLRRSHATGRFKVSEVAGRPSTVSPAAPHPVYSISGDRVLPGGALGAAKFSGWQAFAVQEDKTLAAIEFTGKGSDPREFSSLTRGPRVEGTVAALAAAEAAPQVKDKDYEVRFLRIPSIYVVALWLHGATDDLFVPVDPVPRELTANRIYSEAEFFAAASAILARRSRFDDRPKGVPPRNPP